MTAAPERYAWAIHVPFALMSGQIAAASCGTANPNLPFLTNSGYEILTFFRPDVVFLLLVASELCHPAHLLFGVSEQNNPCRKSIILS